MTAYRFCRSDDVPLLVAAHNACWLPSFPDQEPLDESDLKGLVREQDLWTSSCMVALHGEQPIGVLLAGKRDAESLIWRVAVHPQHQRHGHGAHLLRSLAQKLAILGPPRLRAEVPATFSAALRFFAACGYREETRYTDFVHRGGGSAPAGIEALGVAIGLEEIRKATSSDEPIVRCWRRTDEALARGAGRGARGLAVVSEVQIEAYVLFRDAPTERELLRLGGARDPRGRALLAALLCSACEERRPVRLFGALPEEVPFDLLQECGFQIVGERIGLAAVAGV